MLQFCLSQQVSKKPFVFTATGIRVFSFEEALYHTYHYWKESLEDCTSEKMITWVSDIGHPFLAPKIESLAKRAQESSQIIGFLQLVPYFSGEEIGDISLALEAWEKSLAWEKLKDQADRNAKKGDVYKALLLYKRALLMEENAKILNNFGIACMQISIFGDAVKHLTRALELAPNNADIRLHLIEAFILNGDFEAAERELAKGEHSAHVYYLHGLLTQRQGNFDTALKCYKKALDLEPSNRLYLYKQFELGEMIELPPPYKKSDAGYFAKLAEYYRKQDNLQAAEDAANLALQLDPESLPAQLQSAAIKKAHGNVRGYKAQLSEILKATKERFT